MREGNVETQNNNKKSVTVDECLDERSREEMRESNRKREKKESVTFDKWGSRGEMREENRER